MLYFALGCRHTSCGQLLPIATHDWKAAGSQRPAAIGSLGIMGLQVKSSWYAGRHCGWSAHYRLML